MTIQVLTSASAARSTPQLVELLRDAVEHGASLGFLPPISDALAISYWQTMIREIGTGNRIVLAVVDDAQIVGSVQLRLADQPNAEHRAEVQKLFVHTAHRGKGYGKALMERIEAEAYRRGRRLLILDVNAGADAESLYESLGWSKAGTIPAYARQADGSLADTVIYYKQLS